MRVVDARTGTRERERGTATRRIEYTGDQIVNTREGPQRAMRVEISFEADLRLADATTRTTRWIIPGLGIVLEEEIQQISALGIPGDEKKRTIRLLQSPLD